MKALLLTIALTVLMSAKAMALPRTELRSIPTRPGVTLEYLLMTPDQKPPRDILVLFPGGNGVGPFRLTEEGSVFGWSFLVRSSDSFVRAGLAVAVINPPSDHLTGMSGGFRESQEHADDITLLLQDLAKRGAERIFLVGNSRGTLSVAALATKLVNPLIKGIILTSTLDYENFMRYLPLEKISLPVLMIHHRADACRVSAFEEAEKTRNHLTATTRMDFVELNGGAYPRSPPCDNLSAHAFFGLEDQVVPIIADWVLGRKIPGRITDSPDSPPTRMQTLDNYK